MQGIKKTNEEALKVVDEGEGAGEAGRFGLLQFYYILTPLFLITELVWGVRIRVPLILASAELRYGYYGVCFACGVLCYFRQKLTPVVTIVESTINIALLCSGFYLTVLNSGFDFAEGKVDKVPEALTYKGILGFVLALVVWMIAFKRSEWILFKGKYNLK
ncbi:MAG: hypothetical protein ACYSRZ_05320 [Planctomycetota bacterium]